MTSHRSQGGPFHIVQITKKRQNSNCKFYNNGNCEKYNRVCELNDVCFGFSANYVKNVSNKNPGDSEEQEQVKTRKKEFCKYYDGCGFCNYLEKKCNSTNNCISFRYKESVKDSIDSVDNRKKFITAQQWIYVYRSGKKLKNICLLSSVYDDYVIDGIECIYSYQFSYINKIKNCEDIFLHGLYYKFVSKQLKNVTLILNSVAKSSFRIQQEELQTNFVSRKESLDSVQRSNRDKTMCKHYNNNYCNYLEKKCHGIAHCISFKIK